VWVVRRSAFGTALVSCLFFVLRVRRQTDALRGAHSLVVPAPWLGVTVQRPGQEYFTEGIRDRELIKTLARSQALRCNFSGTSAMTTKEPKYKATSRKIARELNGGFAVVWGRFRDANPGRPRVRNHGSVWLAMPPTDPAALGAGSLTSRIFSDCAERYKEKVPPPIAPGKNQGESSPRAWKRIKQKLKRGNRAPSSFRRRISRVIVTDRYTGKQNGGTTGGLSKTKKANREVLTCHRQGSKVCARPDAGMAEDRIV